MPQDISANNKRIAKNTVFLYFRMFASMLISLFTSREVIRILGVEDYGVYSVVGNVVLMFSFLNSTMSGATSRFLTYEIGRGNKDDRLGKIFVSAKLAHWCIAAIIVVLGETIGLWFLNNKMVIPECSRIAAMWVYQLSIISTVIGITQVPYNATLIAHEKFGLFAYIDLANLASKLGILYLLYIIPYNKLIVYAILIFLVSFFTAATYRYVAYKRFEEIRTKLGWYPNLLKPMFAYSGLDMYGNLSVTARESGVQMLVNIFFGPVVNAAAGIASTIQNTVMAFANNITTAIRPQIIKSYAGRDYDRTYNLICNGSNIIFALLLFLSLPLIVNIDFVLKIWLHEVPDYTNYFVICTLIFNLFSGMSFVAVTGCHATGHIKRPSLLNGSLYLLVIPLTYVSFRYLNTSPIIPYIFNFSAIAIGALSNAYTCHLYIPGFSFKGYIKKVLLRCLGVAFLGIAVVFSIDKFLSFNEWINFIVLSLLSCFVTGVLSWLFLLNKTVKVYILNTIKKNLFNGKRID